MYLHFTLFHIMQKSAKRHFFKQKKNQLTVSKLPLPTHHVITFEPIKMLGVNGELNQTFYYSKLRFEYSYHREAWKNFHYLYTCQLITIV